MIPHAVPFLKTIAVPVFINLFFLAPVLCAEGPSFPVRVAVIRDAERVTLSVDGAYDILALPKLELMMKRDAASGVPVIPVISGLNFGGEQVMIYGVRLRPSQGSTITVNDRRFRGDIDLIRTEKTLLLVINHLDLEEYLYGVLYHEVSHRWPIEALKAQAVASRTFAVYECMRNKGKDYDLTDDIYSQVYGGKTSEKRRTNNAIDMTRGEVLTYDGKVFPSYFHAACGGHTEDASALWNMDIPPLDGRFCAYCRSSPHRAWKASVALGEMRDKLRGKGHKVGNIITVIAASRDKSGRVEYVDIKHTGGNEKISGNNFRLALGPNRIRSANFRMRVAGGKVVFEGNGWGHGVGLCQWGAFGMSKRGFDYTAILNFYYPGSRLTKLETVVR